MESEKIKDNNLHSIQTLSLNPFFLSLLLQHFLNGYKGKKAEYHLLYLVFPIIFYKPSREFLFSATKKSSIFSMYLKDVNQRVLLGGIQERYSFFKELTDEAIIVAVNEGKISISKEVSLLSKVNYEKIKVADIRYYMRAAHYLGVIFARTNYVDIFRKLGVRTL
ncbi:three component ABC system middle component [Paenibacillus sp. FSL R7-0652]|uniref:three component ABC system middle component n=1 Tax=Paenibacillus sp. FSL R7-0652 TaxID=2921687 RepID=UPI00315A383E